MIALIASCSGSVMRWYTVGVCRLAVPAVRGRSFVGTVSRMRVGIPRTSMRASLGAFQGVEMTDSGRLARITPD
jgi:hypothetical protein